MNNTVFYLLQGNSCSGSTGRLRRLGLNIVDSDYFGNVESIEEFIKYAIKEMQEKITSAKIVIVGSSFGGHLLLYLVVALIRSNDGILKKIIGVVLTGTPPSGTPERIARAFLPPAETVEPGGRSVLELLAAPDVMTDAEARRFVLPAFGPSTEYDHQSLIEENIKNVTTNSNMGKTRHGILSSLSTDEFELAQIIIKRMKMLFINAAKDPVISRPYVEEVARDLGAPLKVIDGYHYSHWSNAEEFADILTSFAVECNQ